MDLSRIVGTDRLCVAGWVTYFRVRRNFKEKGAPAGGGAGAETEDDEEGVTPAQSDVEGSESDGQ